MTDLRDAARQALEALESTQLFAAHEHYPRRRVADAQDALRAALEQPKQEVKGCDHCNHPLYAAIKCRVCGRVTEPEPEQEPVAWMTPGKDIITCNGAGTRFNDWTPLYTHPPRREWRGLTNLELVQIELKLRKYHDYDRYDLSLNEFGRAIEAALKERNV